MFLKYVFGDFRGGNDNSLNATELEAHYRAINFGKRGEGMVGISSELMKVSNDGKRVRPRRKFCRLPAATEVAIEEKNECPKETYKE